MWFINYAASWISQLSGLTSLPAAIALALFVGVLALARWHRLRRREGRPGVQWWHIFAGAIGVAWIFAGAGLGAMVYFLVKNDGFAAVAATTEGDRGPLAWFYNLEVEGLSGRPVYTLRFSGANVSQREVRLISASIRSAIKGTELPLEVLAEGEWVPIDKINLIPPGSPIKLIAKFNFPNGMADDEFLASWSKFNLVVADDTREYRLPFNEGNIAVFFPGKVGPHITKK